MLDVLNKVEYYHSLAKEYRRLAAFSVSAQMQNYHSQMAEHYSALALRLNSGRDAPEQA